MTASGAESTTNPAFALPAVSDSVLFYVVRLPTFDSVFPGFKLSDCRGSLMSSETWGGKPWLTTVARSVVLMRARSPKAQSLRCHGRSGPYSLTKNRDTPGPAFLKPQTA